MAKRELTATQINNLLKFNPEWIKDPVPIFRRYLDRATLKQIATAKSAFGKQINEIVRSRAK